MGDVYPTSGRCDTVAAFAASDFPRLGRGVAVRIILNILWLLLSGIWLFVAYMFAAILCFIFIITIPFGVAALRIGFFALWPFGRTVIKKPSAGAGSLIVNILWFIIAGWYLTLLHIITGVLECLTIIGIPLGLGNFKMIRVSLAPFGREIVSVEEANAMAGVQGIAIG
jgi:uncharacterized membrane protein YccF (DUF307 family)